MVEQNFRFAAPLADRFYVMEHGHIVESFAAGRAARRRWACCTSTSASERAPAAVSSLTLTGDIDMKLQEARPPPATRRRRHARSAPAAQAQISDGVIKIGVMTDMSGLYADIAGPARCSPRSMAVEDFGAAAQGHEGRGARRRPPEQARRRLDASRASGTTPTRSTRSSTCRPRRWRWRSTRSRARRGKAFLVVRRRDLRPDRQGLLAEHRSTGPTTPGRSPTAPAARSSRPAARAGSS